MKTTIRVLTAICLTIALGCEKTPFLPKDKSAKSPVMVDSTASISNDTLYSTSNYKTGDIVIGTRGKGFLKKIIQKQGNAAITKPAALSEAFVDGVISSPVTFSSADSTLHKTATGWSISVNERYDKLSINGTVSFEPEMDININIANSSAHFFSGIRMKSNLTITCGGGADANFTRPLFSKYFGTFEIPTPLGPVLVTPRIDINLFAYVRAVARAGMTMITDDYISGTLDYDGDWQAKMDTSFVFSLSPSAQIDADCKAGLLVTMSAEIYDVAGPMMSGDAYLRGIVNPLLEKWLQIRAGVSLKAGFQASVLGFAESVSFDLYNKEWVLLDINQARPKNLTLNPAECITTSAILSWNYLNVTPINSTVYLERPGFNDKKAIALRQSAMSKTLTLEPCTYYRVTVVGYGLYNDSASSYIDFSTECFPPIPSIEKPINNTTLSALPLQLECLKLNSQEGSYYFQIINNNKVIKDTLTAAYVWNIPQLPEGTYSTRVRFIAKKCNLSSDWSANTKFSYVKSTIVPPTINTLVATNISTSGAMLNANLKRGYLKIKERGFCWDFSNNNPSLNNQHALVPGTSDGNYSLHLGSITPATTMYYKAYAIDSVGSVFYGNSISFTTLNANVNHPPVISKPIPIDGAVITSQDAWLSWSVADADGDATTSDLYLDKGDGLLKLFAYPLVSNTYQLKNLNPNTTYRWQIYARDSKDMTQSPVWSFKTNTALLDWGVSLTSMNFGYVPLNSSMDIDVYVYNYSNTSDLKFNVSSSIADVTIESPSSGNLLPGKGVPIKIRFTPKEAVQYDGTLKFDAGASGSISIPISGIGQ